MKARIYMKLIPFKFESTLGWDESVLINPHQVVAIDEYQLHNMNGEPFSVFRVYGPSDKPLAEGVGTARAVAEALKFMVDTKREV